MPQRIFTRPKLVRQVLADNCYQRVGGAFGLAAFEFPSSLQGEPQGAKVTRADDIVNWVQFFAFRQSGSSVGRRGSAAELKPAKIPTITKGNARGGADRLDSRQRQQSFDGGASQLAHERLRVNTTTQTAMNSTGSVASSRPAEFL